MNPSWPRQERLNIVLVLGAGIILIALAVGIAFCTPTQLLYFLLAGLVLAAIVTAYSFENLLVVYIWFISVVHLLKRAIFLLGPQSQFTYYSVLFLPTVMFGVLAILALPRIGLGWKLPSTRLLLVFIAWSLATTLFPLSPATWTARLAAVHERILPMTAFAIGLAVPLNSPAFKRVARAILYSAGISVGYGVILYLNGPTLLERAWALGTATYSIQGQKVLDLVLGGPASMSEWRGFSFYADPATWSLSLVAAIAAALATWRTQPQGLKTRALLIWLPVLLLGLFVCLSRSPWLGLLAMVGTYLLLRWRPAQRTSVLTGLLVFGFVIVIIVGTYLVETIWFMMPNSENEIVRRYSTIGTLGVRIGAWEGLKRTTVEYPVRGAGFAAHGYTERSSDADWSVNNLGGHNYVVEIAFCTGFVGILLFGAFLISLLNEGTRGLKLSRGREAIRWLLAFAVGYVYTGYFSGGVFMNVYFFILAGVLAATALEHSARERESWPVAGSAYSSSATHT